MIELKNDDECCFARPDPRFCAQSATNFYQTLISDGGLRSPDQALTWYTSGRNWSMEQQEIFANKVYGPQAAKGRELGNTEVGDGWKFLGTGLKQVTGRTNATAFATYVDGHPIVGQPTGAQILDNPVLHVAQNKEMAARSAAHFWSQNVRQAPDFLNEVNPPPYSQQSTVVNGKTVWTYDPFTTRVTRPIASDRSSFESRRDQWQSNVQKAYSIGNPFEEIQTTLKNLGFVTKAAASYESKFGLNLRGFKPLEIAKSQLLLADQNVTQTSSTPITKNLKTLEGDTSMLLLDIYPVSDIHSAPALVAPVDQSILVAKATVFGSCVTVSQRTAGQWNLWPLQDAHRYWGSKTTPTLDESVDVIVRGPKHGELLSDSPPGFRYVAKPDFVGNDSFVIKVESKGRTITLTYFVSVYDDWSRGPSSYPCNKAPYRKVSTISSVNDIDLAAWQRSANLSALIAAAQQTLAGFTDLPGTALGETVGEGTSVQITLDQNAAGHGWYIDPTPLDSSDDYLPTSNPEVWQAKAGSAAAGKMDMLSVLLHEYGHALGLEHSADARDFMATTLQPGERRLPSSEELALMSQLVAQLKADSASTPTDPAAPFSPTSPLPGMPLAGLGLFALGRLRSDRYGTQTLFAPNGSVLASVPQYDVAANATLTNGQFNAANNSNSNSTSTAPGWATEGSISIATGSATLVETATQQTRLNQVFIVGPQDRYLSFTLSGIALDDAAAGPDDALEVALLNANTGASLLGNIALTRTDALLNLQANGAELAASGVTFVTNLDGSRTYLVDLAGVNTNGAAGTAVNLSFDLIGFGTSAPNLGSHATVSRVRLLSNQPTPQTRDDSVTLAEDTVAQIIALANDVDANQQGMAPVVVTGPLHGQVVVNADGSFGYTPNANFFGTDSFTYQINQEGNAGVHSNVSTVSITVTPMNDAPVAPDLGGAQTTLAEDSTLTLDLLAGASDVDSPVLTAAIVAGPQHGSLSVNANGTYSYTPAANYFGADSFTYRVNDGASDGALDSGVATVSLTVTPVNDAPVAADVAVSTFEDNVVTINLVAIDEDNMSATLQFAIQTQPVHGSLVP